MLYVVVLQIKEKRNEPWSRRCSLYTCFSLDRDFCLHVLVIVLLGGVILEGEGTMMSGGTRITNSILRWRPFEIILFMPPARYPIVLLVQTSRWLRKFILWLPLCVILVVNLRFVYLAVSETCLRMLGVSGFLIHDSSMISNTFTNVGHP